MRRRVVVTGIGCISPVGHSPVESWEAVCSGRSGVSTITRFDASQYPTQIGAEVRNFSLSRWIDDVRPFAKTTPNMHFGVAAAIEALKDSGLDREKISDPTRIGVYLGAGEGQPGFDAIMQLISRSLDGHGGYDLPRFTEIGLKMMDAELVANEEPNVLAARVAEIIGAEGPNLNSLTACAASAQAIGEGTELIRDGSVDVMIAGGSHSMIHPFGLTGFCLLTALSTRNDSPQSASRPFDRERDGFVLGEGAAMLILEEYEHARRRQARIYGEVSGYGVTADAYRITDIPPDGNGVERAVRKALKDASLNVDDIHYVNAHGTSTSANDSTETSALKKAFESYAYRVPISSTKGVTGHLVAACGGLEAIFCLLALKDNLVPPTANYEYPDPECDLDYVPNRARELKLKHVMSNNSGFGGQNVSLIFSRI